MERFRNITLILCLAMLLPASAFAAQSASVLLQEGLHAEQITGDLDAAIKVYQRVLQDFPNSREQAAQALLHIGLCYEKLGRQEAQKAYERLVEEYADQPEPVRIARKKLEQIDAGTVGASGNGPTYRLVLDSRIAGMPVKNGDWNRHLDFSPTGERIVFESEGKLYIADETGTLIRPLLDNFAPWKGFQWPRWSPDGRQIAYVAYKEVTLDSGEKDGRLALFVVSADGGKPRQIGDETGRPYRWIRWTYDGQHLTYLGLGIHTIDLDGDEVRVIPYTDLPGQFHSRRSDAEYSPNGRWLAYSGGSGNRTMGLWILPATGGQAQDITHSGDCAYPTWAPDGCTLYFVSGQPNTGNIWKVAVDPETGVQEGQPQQVTFFNDAKVTFPRALADGSRVAFELQRTNTSIQVANGSPPYEPRTVARGYDHVPQVSPDGRTVYYVADGIYAVSREGGTPRRLTDTRPARAHNHLATFHLSRDGRTLAYGSEIGDGCGLFTLPVSGGEPKLLAKLARQGVVPRWSPDGSQLAYSSGNDLYVIGTTGGKPNRIAHLQDTGERYTGWDPWTVRWSPDGKFIAAIGAICRPKTARNNAVFVVPASGGEPRQLTPDKPEYLEGLEWHPDGRRLSYNVCEHNSQTRLAYLDGRAPTLLVDHPDGWDYIGSWTPDGRRFFYVSEADAKEGAGIYAYDEASGDITLFADHTASQSPPCWSRDGKTVAWWATRKTERQAWVMENAQPEPRRDDGKSGVTVRKVFDKWGTPSPDGRYLAYCHWHAFGDLAIHDVVTGEDRDLSDGKRSWDGRIYWADETPVWSPDGKQIAYGWHPYPNMGKPEQLCIVGLDGSRPRVLYPNDSNDVKSIDVHDWSKDGKFILASFQKALEHAWDLVLVSVADGSVRTLTSIEPTIGRPAWQISRNLSPDGRYAVYDRSIKDHDGLRDIFLVPTDGSGAEILLVEHPADDWAPLWAPDGKNIVFTSDRSGNYSTWLIPVADGEPAGEAQLVKRDTGPMLPLGFTREGSFYYAVTIPTINWNASFSIGDIYVASIDPASGEVLSSPARAIKSFEGFNGLPAWSPDGKHLAYVSGRPSPNSARRRGALVIRDMESGQEQALFPQVRWLPLQYLRWSPDGRSILCGRSLQLVDVDTGTVTDLVKDAKPRRISDASWSHDGRAIFYILKRDDGPTYIMVYDLETGEAKEFRKEELTMRDCLAISPDGRQLAFSLGSKTIKVMPTAGGEPRELLSLADEEKLDKELAWATDGRHILFKTRNGDQPEVALCRVPIEGGQPQALLELEDGAMDITVNPDGRRIAFTVAGSNEQGTWAIDNFLPESTQGK